MTRRVLPVLAVVAILTPTSGQLKAAGAACDRDCLRGMMTRYLDALVAHNQKIAEIETMVVRNRAEGAIFDVDSVKTPSLASL